MRIPLIAGNWKMNTTLDEARSLVQTMRPELDRTTGVEQVICPPFISLAALRDMLETSPILLGAQDLFWEDTGAYTGAVSGVMLAPLCQYVIVGHSEQRRYFGVTDDVVNRKLKAAVRNGLSPILCVGESLPENEGGLTNMVVTNQIHAGLVGIAACPGLVVAYEPIWAIGTGRPATGEGANAVAKVIRHTIGEVLGESVAQITRILYGGSVTSSNVAEFVTQPEIDGALVGGASLRASEFVSIVRITAQS